MIDAIALAIVAATPLLLAVEGEVVVERSGLLNLGIEGMMLTAAMTSVLAAQLTGSVPLGFVGGIAGALLIGALFGFFAIVAKADQIVTGTAINLLAVGATGLVYREKGALFSVGVPRVEGPATVVFAWVAAPLLLALILWNTTFGLRLRACGENPEAVRAAGANVASYRWAALAIECILCHRTVDRHLRPVETEGGTPRHRGLRPHRRCTICAAGQRPRATVPSVAGRALRRHSPHRLRDCGARTRSGGVGAERSLKRDWY